MELGEAERLPEEIAEKLWGALLDAVAKAEAARKEAGDARAEGERQLAEADKQSRSAEAVLSAAREERARAQALSESAAQRIEELRARIHDEIEAAPEDLRPPRRNPRWRGVAAAGPGGKTGRAPEAGTRTAGRGQSARRGRSRRAGSPRHQPAAEHDDLAGAIERLRRGITTLNNEGRARLLDAFEQGEPHFQTLFTTLFEGGEAGLTLTENEDPLEAGLEIFARPPGKRLQSLSLLSGGEQALTATALIFAVFLVNPAPVCVLDEVDAPLDDANVDRFCNLLDEMPRMTGTRFIVITHNAVTMSRMDRLFGVTMAERGISQLVSVSLAEAEKVAAE